jgi:hypothetical protein
MTRLFSGPGQFPPPQNALGSRAIAAEPERARLTDFLEEIEENLRSDRYKQLFQRSWPWVAGIAAAALIAALGYWGWDSWRSRQEAKASESYAAGLDALQKHDPNKAFDAFAQTAGSGARGYESLALMEQAGIRFDQGKHEEGVELLDKAAANAPDQLVGDLARLKSAFALMDTAPYSTIEERLTPLTDAKRPYHAAAREALAMAKLKAGRIQEAKSDLQVLRLMPDASEAARQRAGVALVAIDAGAVSNLAAVVKAAQALPPAPPLPPAPEQPAAGAGQ